MSTADTALLLSGQNTEAIRRRVAHAAVNLLPKPFDHRFKLYYEHGQWWALGQTEAHGGPTWAVEDADGPGSFDGFTFEGV